MLALAVATVALAAVRHAAAAEGEQCNLKGTKPCLPDRDRDIDTEDSVSLLQVGHPSLVSKRDGAQSGDGLALMHIPYNFGHTLERVALLGTNSSMMTYLYVQASVETQSRQEAWKTVESARQPGGEIWGHFNPDLLVTSNVTGCPLYFTPQKYWPEHLLQKYFGDKKVFGMLRDPYERLVAMFRGNLGPLYGGSYPEYYETCDANGAVRQMMEKVKAGNVYAYSCTFVPQAEYFDGPYGITVPIDNRDFPDSMNKVLVANNHSNMFIETQDVLHVSGCPEVWANDLDCDTRRLVKEVYARDFELLCSKLGHCDDDENTCIRNVPSMCPTDTSVRRKVC